MDFSYRVEPKDFNYALSYFSVKWNIDRKKHRHEGYVKIHKISGNLTFQNKFSC